MTQGRTQRWRSIDSLGTEWLVAALLIAVALSGCGDMRSDRLSAYDGYRYDTYSDNKRDVPLSVDTRGDLGPSTRAEVSGDWPPMVALQKESVEIGTDGGFYTFFDGSVTLLVPVGSFDTSTMVEVTRTVLKVNDSDYVGYIWGPHLVALAPAAKLTVRVPKTWLPPDVQNAQDGGLLQVTADHELQALPKARLENEGQTDVSYSGELELLTEIVIGKLPQ